MNSMIEYQRMRFALAGCLSFFVAAVSLAAEPDGAVSLFDGKTFKGWEGDLKVFRIEEGAIVGGSLERDNPRNEFLCTEREYGDFELTLKFKVLGKGANAGIQIRSRRIPDHHEMIGYQADLGDNYWGSLYDESRRNKILAAADAQAVAAVLKRDDWNEYRIRCEGKRIQLWINGLKTVDYTEPDDGIEQRGLIGLQIHGGPPSEAWYKDITLREIRK
jgi:hypothetical protein